MNLGALHINFLYSRNTQIITINTSTHTGDQNRVVGIATCYWLDGPAIECPSRPAQQPTPASYIVGIGSFPSIKWPERGANDPPHSTAEVANGLETVWDLKSVNKPPIYAA